MYFEQIYLGCLAHASYLLGSNGVGVVVDPRRDVDVYFEAAEKHGLKIEHIFETHLHADFVSGHRELARRSGAQIYIGARAGARFAHIAIHDGFELSFGDCRIRALETPGHTPESVCLLVFDPGKQPQPWAALTGDTLFIGDVGRPDLSPTHSPQQLAAMLYDSLHQKLLTLPDAVTVYPAHGAGSLCGRSMRAESFSTIGTEKLTNPMLQIASREEFVRELTSHLITRPDYFTQDAEINRSGAPGLDELPPLPALSSAEFNSLRNSEVVVVDVRPSSDYAAGHVPGAINIGLGGQFATWAAIVLGLHTPVILVANSPEQAAEARMRLARVGIEEVAGYLADGIEGWKRTGHSPAVMTQITARELRSALRRGLQVVDVRREPEWEAGHIEGATWAPLDDFRRGLPELDRQSRIAVHCKGGYRSAIACSLLMRAGFENVIDVAGGYDAWVEEEKSAVAQPVRG